MLSKSERDAIRAREQAATKGPWEFQESQGMDCRWLDIMAGDDDDEILSAETAPRPHIVHASGQQKVEMATQQSIRNLEFCAHARADIPALLDDLDAKDAELAELAELKADLGAGCYENGCMAHAVEALRQRAEAAEQALSKLHNERMPL